MPDVIREKNDKLRKLLPSMPRPHKLILTLMTRELPLGDMAKLIQKVRDFDSFDPDENDTYNEHDFGAIDLDGETYYWKFDYYDKNFEYFEEDGVRVLTLMHSSEY